MADGRLELGVALPNGSLPPSPGEVLRVAEAADSLGYDSVWVADHVIVGAEAPSDFAAVLEPFSCLAWVAGRFERLALGTSVIVLPMHHPIEVAQQAATLQYLSAGRFRLGIGVGWHDTEFHLLGQDFSTRGRRTDEAIRLMRALWAGESSFEGEYWSLRDARFGLAPAPPPELWVGGNSPAASRRAREADAVWHPIAPSPDDIRALRQEWPEARVVPRVRVRLGRHEGAGLQGSPDEVRQQVEDLVAAGAEGLVLAFVPAPDSDRVADMEAFAREVMPALSG